MDEKVVSDRSERTHAKLLWITALGVLSVVFGSLVWASPEVTAPLEETALIQLFERVSPAVVAVVAKRSSPQATVAGHEGRGSGFSIDREGHLLTTKRSTPDGGCGSFYSPIAPNWVHGLRVHWTQGSIPLPHLQSLLVLWSVSQDERCLLM